MALATLCGTLNAGQDWSCVAPTRKYYQQAVVINRSEIDLATIEAPWNRTPTPTTCDMTAHFEMLAGEKGYHFVGGQKGSIFLGTYSTTTSDLGIPQYSHAVTILVGGFDNDAKCIIDGLVKGLFVVALQAMDGTVEIFGLQNGLVSADTTFDMQGGGGGTPLILNSMEDAPESFPPLVYVSDPAGQETEDFDSAFANTTP